MALILYVSLSQFLNNIFLKWGDKKEEIVIIRHRNFWLDIKKAEAGLGIFGNNGVFINYRDLPNCGFSE